ncbi:MAG: hypothetical protein ABSF53_24025 [Terracidiphilus sp.]
MVIKKPSGPTCDPYIAVTGPAADGASLELRLCDFPRSHSELTAYHREALYKYIYVPTFNATGAWVDLTGYASKLQFRNEQAGDNLHLSWARCLAVKKVLEPWFFGLRPNFRINNVEPKGDTQSQDDLTLDHPFYRAVSVRLFTSNYHLPPVKIDPPRIWQPKPSSSFDFEASEGASVSIFFYEMSSMIFAIHDLTNHRRRYYGCWGDGFSLSVPKLPPVMASAQHASSPVHFDTRVGFLDMKDFEGDGWFGGAPGATVVDANVGGRADFYMKPNLYKRRGITEPIHISFSFSKGFGLNVVNLDKAKISILSESFRPTVYRR